VEQWRLKCCALWLKAGNNNTKYFHHFANLRKNINTIWDIKKEDGSLALSFEEKSKVGVHYFQNLFKATRGSPIQTILQVVKKFPRVFNE
jgi:hypothetical protein